MFIYSYIDIYVCTCIYIYMYVYLNTYTCLFLNINIFIFLYIYIFGYLHIYIFIKVKINWFNTIYIYKYISDGHERSIALCHSPSTRSYLVAWKGRRLKYPAPKKAQNSHQCPGSSELCGRGSSLSYLVIPKVDRAGGHFAPNKPNLRDIWWIHWMYCVHTHPLASFWAMFHMQPHIGRS